jgi:hypothetical protein
MDPESRRTLARDVAAVSRAATDQRRRPNRRDL